MEEVPGSRINYFANFVLLGGPGLVAYPLYGTFFPPWEIDGRRVSGFYLLPFMALHFHL